MQLIAAYSANSGVVLAPQQVETKANEISVAPGLLGRVDLAGKVVTGDAIYTQRSLCEQIVNAGGHYLVVVKANQPDLLAALQSLFLSLSGSAAPTSAARSSMGEDAYQVRTGSGPEALATLRNAALSILHLSGIWQIAAALQYNIMYIPKLIRSLGLSRVL